MPSSGSGDSASETSAENFSSESHSGLVRHIPVLLEDLKDVSISSSLLAGVRAAAGLRSCLSFVVILSWSEIQH